MTINFYHHWFNFNLMIIILSSSFFKKRGVHALYWIIFRKQMSSYYARCFHRIDFEVIPSNIELFRINLSFFEECYCFIDQPYMCLPCTVLSFVQELLLLSWCSAFFIKSSRSLTTMAPPLSAFICNNYIVFLCQILLSLFVFV